MMSRRNILAAGGSTAIMAMVGATNSSLAQSAAPQTSPDVRTTSDTLGANARQVMIDIFRKKDPAAVDRHFAESFIQHDPNLTDGLAGMKLFAAEAASSTAADITIYRTLVDGDFVLLHSLRSLSTCFVSRTARSLSTGADRNRRRLLICQDAHK
jgi:predicted SnoaL-like aldol condensation-catalyzing enzyme